MQREEYDRFEAAVAKQMAERLEADEDLCFRLWSSLANVEWHHEEGASVGYSWRSAGGLIAETTGRGDYLDWYMSGPAGVTDAEIVAALGAEGSRPEILA